MSQAKAQAEAFVDASEGPEDYASFTLVIDHLILEPFEGRNGEIPMKLVFSNKSAHAALINQIGYFQHEGAPNLLTDEDHFATVASGLNKDVIYVYTPNDRTTQVVVDNGLAEGLLDNPQLGNGSLMQLHASLIQLALDMKRAAQAEGKPTNLLVYIPATTADYVEQAR